jgi:hypothetical protein
MDTGCLIIGKVTHQPLDFAICFSGFKLQHQNYERFYRPKIQTPILHFIASLDTMITEQLTQELYGIAQNAKSNTFRELIMFLVALVKQ